MAKYLRVRREAAALASESRLRMIDRLQRGSASSSELTTAAGVGLPALHKHLEVLREAKLITSSKTGRVVTHRLRPGGLEALSSWIDTRKAFWRSGFATLDAALAADDHAADDHEEQQ
ncbi:winged helix-turn-helix transcriptional regulator [Microlunatus elymi]|uniref:Winged helix-turn-helix transcriptional regulator n=1 Tax=Microlunatus elymi TaxID=2596828 RepID=A0A516PYW8_9ACTN|nr:metalloregulator ArsR/SmtB family transcription factor [Microlunatus elymi]QDP96379.1 winged helix-turn-helix transcriptional regulator [Microlunatus elymi]